MTQDDDEALSWDDGTDDATHVGARRAASAPAVVDDLPADSRATGSAMLVVLGILAGAYLLFTIGWVLAALRGDYTVPNLLGEIMYQLGQFLAIVAPALWFGTVLLLTRRRTALVRVVWLVVGAVLLAPWPFLLAGGGA